MGDVVGLVEKAADVIDQEEAEKLAMADDKVLPFVEGKAVAKVIYVPDKLVNIVVK